MTELEKQRRQRLYHEWVEPLPFQNSHILMYADELDRQILLAWIMCAPGLRWHEEAEYGRTLP